MAEYSEETSVNEMKCSTVEQRRDTKTSKFMVKANVL